MSKILSIPLALLILVPLFTSAEEETRQRVETRIRPDRVEVREEIRIRTGDDDEREEVRERMELRVGTAEDTDADASEETREERSERTESRRASWTERRIETQQSVVERKVEQTARVLRATIERLERILERVESRIAKVKSAGGDTSASEASALEVETHLSNARLSLEAFLAVELTADSFQENFALVRESATEVKMHLREAHRSLMETVRELKVSVEVEASASTTTSTN